MDTDNYIYTLSLGGVYLRLYSEIALEVTDEIEKFLVDDRQISVSWYFK